MVASETAASIARTVTYLLRKIWSEWDVRGMVLLSLLLQVALYVLGSSRKHSVRLINKMILWFAYISADWVAIAALGKLSNARALSPTKNVLRALWAPLLILHLGGPDTITAYALQDTQLWTRHILTLVIQSIFAIYVIYLSWTYLLLSILTIPLILAGIIKYVERILCLELTNSKKTKSVISMFYHPAQWIESAVFLDYLLNGNPNSIIVLAGYLLFAIMRPDTNDYLCSKLYFRSSKIRIKTYLDVKVKEKFSHQRSILGYLFESEMLNENPFDIAATEMGFIFDIVYTKCSLIYTKKGCLLRFISFTCSSSVLLFFLTSIMNEPRYNFSSVDIHITISLLVGAVALEFCAVYSMFSSHWAIPLVLFHESYLVRKILQYVFKYCPCLVFPRTKRWSGRLGQFNLLDYYWISCRNAKVYGFLAKIFSSRILENWRKCNYARFVEVPNCLKLKEDYQSCLDSFLKDDSFEPTKGGKTLDSFKELSFDGSLYTSVKQSIELDFDTSIIVWHLATSVCYYEDVHCTFPTLSIEERESSKYLSDYMMYLLAMQPAMLLPERCSSFWLDACCDGLQDIFSKASNIHQAFTSLLKWDHHEPPNGIRGSTPWEELQQDALNLLKALNSIERRRRWKMIKEMWIEMLLYAAHSCQHVNHVKQLAQYEHEFLTLIWLMGGPRFIEKNEVV